MRRASPLLAFGALGSPAAALLNRIPHETSIPELAQNLAAEGTSPRPTDPPIPRFAHANILPRLDGYTLGPGTCAFVSSDGDPFTCVNKAATCSNDNGYLGCCEPNKECNVIKTTCIDYSASASGACQYPEDFHTLCCASSASPSCFTFLLSTTGTDGSSSTASALICSNRAGSGTLLDHDPVWAATHSFASTTTTPITSTSTSPVPSPTPTKHSSTPVGAIVGGTVGGVAALGLVGVVGFLLYRRKKKQNSAAATPLAVPSNTQSPPPNMAQVNPASPSQSFAPTSPGAPAYPSGVPSNYQYQPQGYDPNMGGYQQGNFPPQQGYNTYSPPPQLQQGQYAPPQQGQYNYAGGYQPSSASPPPGVSPSPAKEGETSPPPLVSHQSGPIPQELDAINPLGNVSNRAELG